MSEPRPVITGHAPAITITGSPTEEEVAAVIATLCRASVAAGQTGRALQHGDEEALRRWRTARSMAAGYRGPRAWGTSA
jgi:hypothetical protein